MSPFVGGGVILISVQVWLTYRTEFIRDDMPILSKKRLVGQGTFLTSEAVGAEYFTHIARQDFGKVKWSLRVKLKDARY